MLFFAVNLILLGSFVIIASLNGVADSNFPIENFSGHIVYGDGKLTAGTHRTQSRGRKITLYVELDVDTCIFKVVDTGCGISGSRLDLLNNGTSISSTQEENIGIDHGLGLKIVQQIVKAHHGKIHFRKNAPHGLIAKISLPLII